MIFFFKLFGIVPSCVFLVLMLFAFFLFEFEVEVTRFMFVLDILL